MNSVTLCSNLVRSLTSLAFFRSRIFAIILTCWEFDSHLCLSFLQFLAVPFSPLLCISSLSLNLCIMHADLSSSLCWVSSILWFCHLLMCPYTDPPPTINIDNCDIPVICTLMINGWPVRVCTTPYWMVGGWFVHYGVSVLMCAVFGDFYRMPNLDYGSSLSWLTTLVPSPLPLWQINASQHRGRFYFYDGLNLCPTLL